jgi:sugar lactone lactonase YvrE
MRRINRRSWWKVIVEIPVKADGGAGTGVTFATGLNGPDGLAVDANDSLWVAANQGDEIVVVDPSRRGLCPANRLAIDLI